MPKVNFYIGDYKDWKCLGEPFGYCVDWEENRIRILKLRSYTITYYDVFDIPQYFKINEKADYF